MERKELSKLGGGGQNKASGLGSWSVPGEVCWLHGEAGQQGWRCLYKAAMPLGTAKLPSLKVG